MNLVDFCTHTDENSSTPYCQDCYEIFMDMIDKGEIIEVKKEEEA